MSNSTIQPTTGNATANTNSLMPVYYVLKRWKKMLYRYGRLDATTLGRDIKLLKKVGRREDVAHEVKEAIAECRAYAKGGEEAIESLLAALKKALSVVSDAQEDDHVKSVKRHYANQGMTERYRPLSKRLAREKIRKINKEIGLTDPETDDSKTTRLVRRFVEKRAAQTVFRNATSGVRLNNRFRQSVRRATSFSLYNSAFADYDSNKRTHGTHWKVVNGKDGKKLKSKKSYATREEAVEACIEYMMRHPWESRPMMPYQCAHCGKWHMGHASQKGADQQPQKAAC